jgi:hypothetical protein
MFRLVRNVIFLGVLAAAPALVPAAVGPMPDLQQEATCGQCSCDPGQCCTKGVLGGCECKVCS